MPEQSRQSRDQPTFEDIWVSVPESVQLKSQSLPVFRIHLVRERGSGIEERADLSGPEAVADILHRYLEHVDREHFVVVLLDTQNRYIGVNTVSVGTLTGALVSARDVFKAAILANAACIIVGHNHPSGDPEPSPEDIFVTQELLKAGRVLDIPLVDHIVIGDSGAFVSLRRRGHMG